jgi:hypothetical protein
MKPQRTIFNVGLGNRLQVKDAKTQMLSRVALGT